MDSYPRLTIDDLNVLFDSSLEERARATIAESRHADHLAEIEACSGMLGNCVLKIHGPCNLACDYCYDTNGVDKSQLELPDKMSEVDVFAAAKAMAVYAQSRGLERWGTTLHGGEPLMVGSHELDKIASILELAFTHYAPSTRHDVSVVTNGTMFSEAMFRVLDRHKIRTIVSLDGGESAHDRHRVNFAGMGTYKLTARGINRLRENYPHLYGGILAVIDTKNDPIEVYESLRAFDPPGIDLLLPYSNWENRPPAYVEAKEPWLPGTPYADWLIPIFDRWQLDYIRHKIAPEEFSKPPGIRFFQSIMDMDLGGLSSTEALGMYTGDEFVIRPGGSVELVDGLKSTFEGAVKTDMNIHTDSVETIASRFRAMGYLGRKTLAYECETCPIHKICGGGHIATRYGHGDFYKPSVFCDDLMKIITYIQAHVSRELRGAQLTVDNRRAIADWGKRISNSGLGRHLAREAAKNVVTIRQATAEDAKEMVSILKASLRADYIKPDQGLTESYWDNLCDAKWQDEKETFFCDNYINTLGSTARVAVVDQKVVGFSLTKDNECAGLYVRKQLRRRHIATALLERSLKSILELGYDKTWVGVASDVSETGDAFYRVNHFKHTGDIIGKGHNGRPGTFADYKMDLVNLEEAHEKLYNLLGIGSLAASVTTQIKIQPISLVSVRLLAAVFWTNIFTKMSVLKAFTIFWRVLEL